VPPSDGQPGLWCAIMRHYKNVALSVVIRVEMGTAAATHFGRATVVFGMWLGGPPARAVPAPLLQRASDMLPCVSERITLSSYHTVKFRCVHEATAPSLIRC